MCQDGASLMAGRGYDYLMILNHYYTGVSLAVAGPMRPPGQFGLRQPVRADVAVCRAGGVGHAPGLCAKFRVTCGFSHATRCASTAISTRSPILGSAGQPWSVAADLEQFLRQVAPSNMTVERVEGAALEGLVARLQDCITQGNPLAYRS